MLIAGPAKAGNMWLKCLLAVSYDLRWLSQAEIPDVVTTSAFEEWVARGGFPDGTIFHQHYDYSEAFADAVAAVPAHLVTIVRDPYDAFVSLYFQMQHQGERHAALGRPQAVMIGKPIDHPDVLDFLARRFRNNLSKADAWLGGGRSLVVRYEDLHRDPAATLRALTERIAPVEPARIERAIETCRAENMRRLGKGLDKHVRAAAVGDSTNHLGDAHLAIFRARYADLIRRLGYEVR